MAVIALIHFDAGEDSAGPHECVLELVDENDVLVTVPISGSKPVPLTLAASIDVEPRENALPESPATASLVVNVGPGIPLKPGGLYTWRAIVNGKSDPTWLARFATNPS